MAQHRRDLIQVSREPRRAAPDARGLFHRSRHDPHMGWHRENDTVKLVARRYRLIPAAHAHETRPTSGSWEASVSASPLVGHLGGPPLKLAILILSHRTPGALPLLSEYFA